MRVIRKCNPIQNHQARTTPTFIHLSFLFRENVMQILPDDDYLKQEIKLSTFTHLNDDILIQIGDTFMIFSNFGKVQRVSLSREVKLLLRADSLKLTQIKVLSNSQRLCLVYEDDSNYYILHLTKEQMRPGDFHYNIVIGDKY